MQRPGQPRVPCPRHARYARSAGYARCTRLTQPFPRPAATGILAARNPERILDAFNHILGSSPQALAIRAFGRQAAGVDATVLLTGETGTGKGILARAIHEASTRARGPFVAVNCAGVPESLFESEFFGHVRGAFTGALHTHRGLLEQADRGTLLLDEIGELPPGLQAKLLTALEDGEYRKVGGERIAHFDARLIAASCIDLELAVEQQRFRSDLYHRLRVLEFRIPPLRERTEDIAPLTAHFLDSFALKYRRTAQDLPPESLTLLQTHHWPGNIRELAHTVEAALLASNHGRLCLRSLRLARPSQTAQRPNSPPAGRYCFSGSAQEEQARIEDALTRCRGNRTHAARALGMSRNTLLGKLRKMNITNGFDSGKPA